MRALLAGEDPDAKVALLAGFYTVELRDYLLANGFEVITCDYRHSEGPGMHYLGDVRNILQARTWTVLVGSPPCKNLSWSTACEYPTKRANGEQWYGLSFVALLYTARALHSRKGYDSRQPPQWPVSMHPSKFGAQKLSASFHGPLFLPLQSRRICIGLKR